MDAVANLNAFSDICIINRRKLHWAQVRHHRSSCSCCAVLDGRDEIVQAHLQLHYLLR